MEWLLGLLVDTYIKGDVDRHQGKVARQQLVVLGQTVGNKSVLNQTDKGDVEGQVDDEEHDLLQGVPDSVDCRVFVIVSAVKSCSGSKYRAMRGGVAIQLTNESEICSLAGIQTMKTLTLMAVIIAATPHFSLGWYRVSLALTGAGRVQMGSTYLIAFHLTISSNDSRLIMICTRS